jgi:glycosyltransferase 2 family protein
MSWVDYWGMPVEGVLEKFGGVSLGAFALALILHVAKLFARARGWHNIVRAAYPENSPRFRDSLGAFLVGVGVDSFVPARAGELLRVELVRRRTPDATFPGLVSTLFAEYVLDVVLTVIVVALVVFTGPMPDGPSMILGPLARHSLFIPAAVGVILLLVALVVRRRPNLRPLLSEARRGLAVLTSPSYYLGRVAGWQVLGWVLRVSSVYWFLVAFGVPATIGTAALVVSVQLAAGAVPLTPGGAGSQQAMLVVALSMTSAASVLAFGIGMQAATVVTNIVLGAISLLAMTGSVRWRALRAAAPDPALPAPVTAPATVP